MRQLFLAVLAGGLLISAGVLFERNRNEEQRYRSLTFSELLQYARGRRDARACIELARRCADGGRFPDALRYARLAQEIHHESAEAFFAEGRLLRLQGRHEEAVPVLEHALKIDPNLAAAYLEAGLAYNKIGHHKQAIAALREYVDREPDDDFGYYWLGAVAMSAGMFDVAERSLQRARKLKPNRAVTYIALGNLRLRVKSRPDDLQKALEYYQTAARLNPDNAEPVELIATVYYRQKRYADAAREFERALQIDPTVAEVYYPLGLAYAKIGEKEKSARCLRIAEVYATGKEAFARPGGAGSSASGER